jgi:hypothetical protein
MQQNVSRQSVSVRLEFERVKYKGENKCSKKSTMTAAIF